MTKLRHPAVLFAAICATALIALSPAAAATQASPACGDTITTSTTLTHNLDCSAGGTEGLVIEGDGITLNLGGHWIKGAGGADGHAGVFIDGGSDVTVRSGTILNFFVDAEANSTTSATFFKLSLKTDGTQ